LLKRDPKDIENSIIAYIIKMKKEGNSYSTDPYKRSKIR